MALSPNQTIAYPQITAGICRHLGASTIESVALTPASETGGGDLNGTAASPIFFSHSGTGLGQAGLPRLPRNVGGV
jgi:hypothetical protein